MGSRPGASRAAADMGACRDCTRRLVWNAHYSSFSRCSK
ncbi:phosphopantetheine adenylyltransferase [Burkholderia pseudomallei]|nr:phosphopantetheine adenylyltransferase [Burkholderia pseudomallei]